MTTEFKHSATDRHQALRFAPLVSRSDHLLHVRCTNARIPSASLSPDKAENIDTCAQQWNNFVNKRLDCIITKVGLNSTQIHSILKIKLTSVTSFGNLLQKNCSSMLVPWTRLTKFCKQRAVTLDLSGVCQNLRQPNVCSHNASTLHRTERERDRRMDRHQATAIPTHACTRGAVKFSWPEGRTLTLCT